jgi:hypothetical protein
MARALALRKVDALAMRRSMLEDEDNIMVVVVVN